MPNNISPDHMDKWSRNERLYHYLKEMGLFVIPIYRQDETNSIDHLIVGTSMPDYKQNQG